MFICDNAKGLSFLILYVALTKTSTVIASSICSCVLLVGLDSDSRKCESLSQNTSSINETKLLKLELFPA